MQVLSRSRRPDHSHLRHCLRSCQRSCLRLLIVILKTAHSIRTQVLHVLHAPQRAPRGALSVPPHHISPTLAIHVVLTSLTLIVVITILCKAALSFNFHKSHPSVHVDLHYFAFLRWVDDARAILLTVVPPDPNIFDSHISDSKITNPRTIMFHCCSHEPNSRLQGEPCSVSFFPPATHIIKFHSLSGL